MPRSQPHSPKTLYPTGPRLDFSHLRAKRIEIRRLPQCPRSAEGGAYPLYRHHDDTAFAPSRPHFSLRIHVFQQSCRFFSLGRLVFWGCWGRVTRKKGRKDLLRRPNRYGVLDGQMAKVELRNCLENNGTGLNGVSWVVQDRKITRLNSSHANISYAVFCLKK